MERRERERERERGGERNKKLRRAATVCWREQGRIIDFLRAAQILLGIVQSKAEEKAAEREGSRAFGQIENTKDCCDRSLTRSR